MKLRIGLAALTAGFLMAGVVAAKELKSGLQEGDFVPAFYVTKTAGAPNDNVAEGDQLCYRCKLGSRPVVMLFSRSADKHVAKLIKELDGVVAKNADKKLSSFVNLLGEDTKELKTESKKLAKEAKLENVAVVVPDDHKDGPESYKISPEADLTVIIYKDSKVAANHAVAKGKLDGKKIAKILEDATKLVK